MKKLKGKILIIPDIHQCIGFANKALELVDFDHVVFLGDYFDCFEIPDNVWHYSMERTCEWLNKTKERLGDRAVWLLGNHDLAYMATYRHKRIPDKNTFYSCSGYTRSKAKVINKRLEPNFFAGLELCCEANGWVCVHAGFHYDHFKPFMSERENILALYESWERDKMVFHQAPWHWIHFVGRCRGGINDIGSPIWLDWDAEFAPVENIKQIVGHTNYWNNDLANIKSRGENYCVDKHRSLCILLRENGEVGTLPIIQGIN